VARQHEPLVLLDDFNKTGPVHEGLKSVKGQKRVKEEGKVR
jgi:hypothetical protein